MKKKSYLSPANGTLEITTTRSAQPSASIVLDLGIPNFSIFSVKFPAPPSDPGVFRQVASEALAVMLDEMSAFMLSTGYGKDVIAKMYALALECYREITERGKAEEEDKDPTVRTARGSFELPMGFVNETQKHVVTAGKKVRKAPKYRALEFVKDRPEKPSKNDVLKAIRRYRFQSIKTQPFPLYLVVYDKEGNPKGTLSLGPGFHNELLRMQYGKKAGQWGVRSYDGDSAHDILDRYRQPGTALGFDEPIPKENVPALLAEIEGMALDTPERKQDYVAVATFLLDHGSEVPHSVRRKAALLARELFREPEVKGWKDQEARRQQVKKEVLLLEGVKGKAAGVTSLPPGGGDSEEALAQKVKDGGGRFDGISGGHVWFTDPDPSCGSSFVLRFEDTTPENVKAKIEKSHREHEDAAARGKVAKLALALPKDLVYHHTRLEYLPSIKAEGFIQGSFSSRPISVWGDVWLAVSLKDLGPVQRHPYGNVIAYEPGDWLSQHPVPADKIYVMIQKGKIVGRLSDLAIEKKADCIDEEGHWAGEGDAASGILPVCPATGRVCLAWRSADVLKGNCWGTIGGAVKQGMSPADSARHELKEETGYGGGILLHPAFVYKDGKFQYFNFVGEVQREFAFRPVEDSAWETDKIRWVGLDDAEALMESDPKQFHPGMLALFEDSGKMIRRLCRKGRGMPGEGKGGTK